MLSFVTHSRVRRKPNSRRCWQYHRKLEKPQRPSQIALMLAVPSKVGKYLLGVRIELGLAIPQVGSHPHTTQVNQGNVGDIDVVAVSCTFGKANGNKGAVGLRIIYGRMRLSLFVAQILNNYGGLRIVYANSLFVTF
ncbi:uncharacterized protein [Rutidosis leptorrhynchoides]|uniref:uncharacterized protein n=1 Tax=Rutidosis leptorrhynchoides TaxID=125765 RepID=UPI003A991D35